MTLKQAIDHLEDLIMELQIIDSKHKKECIYNINTEIIVIIKKEKPCK